MYFSISKEKVTGSGVSVRAAEQQYALIVAVSNRKRRETEVYIFFSKQQVLDWLKRMEKSLPAAAQEALLEMVGGDDDLPPESSEKPLAHRGMTAKLFKGMLEAMEALAVAAESDRGDRSFSGLPAPPPGSKWN